MVIFKGVLAPENIWVFSVVLANFMYLLYFKTMRCIVEK